MTTFIIDKSGRRNKVSYTREQREKAVQLAKEIGKEPAAKRLGMTPSAIRAWERKIQIFGDVMAPHDVYHRQGREAYAAEKTEKVPVVTSASNTIKNPKTTEDRSHKNSRAIAKLIYRAYVLNGTDGPLIDTRVSEFISQLEMYARIYAEEDNQ